MARYIQLYILFFHRGCQHLLFWVANLSVKLQSRLHLLGYICFYLLLTQSNLLILILKIYVHSTLLSHWNRWFLWNICIRLLILSLKCLRGSYKVDRVSFCLFCLHKIDSFSHHYVKTYALQIFMSFQLIGRLFSYFLVLRGWLENDIHFLDHLMSQFIYFYFLYCLSDFSVPFPSFSFVSFLLSLHIINHPHHLF